MKWLQRMAYLHSQGWGWWPLYRVVMRLAHRYDWHYAPVIGPLDPGGDYQRWCHWCGFRQTLGPKP